MTKSASDKKSKASSQKNGNSKSKDTRVTIRYDVGFSNNLFIRGDGAGLNWDQGVLLKNIGPDEWVWEASNPFGVCEFKALINDQMYELGENHQLDDGTWLQYTPNF